MKGVREILKGDLYLSSYSKFTFTVLELVCYQRGFHKVTTILYDDWWHPHLCDSMLAAVITLTSHSQPAEDTVYTHQALG